MKKLSGIVLVAIGRALIDLVVPAERMGARLLVVGWRWRVEG